MPDPRPAPRNDFFAPLTTTSTAAMGLRVSAVGLGTVKLGRNRGVKYPKPFELPSDGDVVDLLEACRDLGVNLLDTAPAYGTSEERLGDIMRAHNWFGGRDNWIVGTKVGESFGPTADPSHEDSQADWQSAFDFSPEAVNASIERSLLRLRTDAVDYALIHSDGRDTEIIEREGTLDALFELRSRGLVRAVGLSGKTAAGARLALERGADLVMITINAEQLDETPAVDEAERLGAGVLVKKALASGHGVDPAAGADSGATLRDAFALALAGGDRSRLGPRRVASVVVGTTSPDHLAQNVAAARAALGG